MVSKKTDDLIAESKNPKLIEALYKLAVGFKEKTVTKTVDAKGGVATVTKTKINKPDKMALITLLEMTGDYKRTETKLKETKLSEIEDERSLESEVNDLYE